MKNIKNKKGFTLIEILIVIVIIAILALVVFIALDPIGRIADANNTTTESNVQQIYKAIQTYTVDNKGNYPTGIPQPSTGSVLDTTTSTPLGFSVTGSSLGTPYCVTGTGTIPNVTLTIATGTAAGDCEQLTSTSSLYSAISSDLGSIPAGNYYVGENIAGDKILVFSTGNGATLPRGATTNTAGYPLVYEYNGGS
jgi:prepilin-type N-terminal cleavage/methylation domain-containing protein